MNAGQFRVDIVRPALRRIEMWSEPAENLVMGTAAVESNLEYIRQLNGPALGMFQMEPATYWDIWDNYLEFRPSLSFKVLQAINADRRPEPERMLWDMRLGAVMCRLHYKRVPTALPDPDDIWSMANYHKEYYNTSLGKSTPEKFVEAYTRLCG